MPPDTTVGEPSDQTAARTSARAALVRQQDVEVRGDAEVGHVSRGRAAAEGLVACSQLSPNCPRTPKHAGSLGALGRALHVVFPRT